MKENPVDIAYKSANKLVADIGRKYSMSDTDVNLLKAEMELVLIELHNSIVQNMKTDILPEINKVFDKFGYKK